MQRGDRVEPREPQVSLLIHVAAVRASRGAVQDPDPDPDPGPRTLADADRWGPTDSAARLAEQKARGRADVAAWRRDQIVLGLLHMGGRACQIPRLKSSYRSRLSGCRVEIP